MNTPIQFLKLLLVFTVLVNTSCVHIKSSEDLKVQLTENEKAQHHDSANYQMKFFIYSESKYPLEDFFTQLKNGDFTESLKSIDLKYTPANTDNKIFKKLIDRGYVPVYLSYQNTSQADIKIQFNQFQITDGKNSISPISPINLPKKFQQFHPQALAANTYNITVTITGVVVIALLLASLRADNFSFNGLDIAPNNNDIVYPLNYTTRIDYQNLVLNEKILKPNESFAGLLFFYNSKAKNLDSYQLKFSGSTDLTYLYP